MTMLNVADVPLESEHPAQRLRRIAAAVRVRLRWWGVHRALTAQQKEEMGAVASADARLLTAGKKLIDSRHEPVRRLASVRTRLGNYWRGLTLPYTEPGLRLIRQADVESFVHAMEGFRDELAEAENGLDAAYDDIKDDARRRLGRLYDPGDYPLEVRGLFGVEWDFPSVEPPSYLMRIAPEVYEQERQRVAARFDEAVRLAEQAFAVEFTRLSAHLTERLSDAEGGQRKVFRDSAVANLSEFFEKFRRLNVRSNPELDALVEQAQQMVRGVEAQDLRCDEGLRRRIATEMSRVQVLTEALVVDAPRRRIVRPQPGNNGGNHATAG
ncbi:MAG TPA: hypothetical protein VMS17_23150 [Gemmataceae bacterium]|nr:hypothetical protein [Gemmataceae bacterium]